uniref:Ferritin n=1 Tax=Ailuropoda melanoleuca TaxID=9646 RepID=A0A7N5KMH5_AILME
MVTAPLPQVRQNYHPDCEAAVNSQINLELYASYVLLKYARVNNCCFWVATWGS